MQSLQQVYTFHVKFQSRISPSETKILPRPDLFLQNSEYKLSDALISLKASVNEKNLKVGSCIHAKTIKLGLDTDVFVANSVLDMYAKCGHVEDALMVFDKMPYRTVVSWTSMISAYCLLKLAKEAISLFLIMMEVFLELPNEHTLAVVLRACGIKNDWRLLECIHSYGTKYGFFWDDDFLQNSLIDAYAKCGKIEAAEKLLKNWKCGNVVSWSSIISGCVAIGMVERAFALFFKMQEDNNILPNEVTILSILRACSEWKNLRMFQWVHGLVLKVGWYRNPSVLNSLVEMYSTNGYFHESARLFCDFCFAGEGLYLNQETMANLIHGCGQSHSLRVGISIKGYVIKNGFLPCTVIENSLIHMYAENEDSNSAFQLFTRMSSKDIISWNSMIRCFVKNEKPVQALSLFRKIHHDGARDKVHPDFVTMLTSVQACSNVGSSLQLGQMLHGYMTKKAFNGDILIQNSLIDMYAKSGRLSSAECIFKEMEEKNLGSWNSMIAAYGIHGNAESALKIFKQLIESKAPKPNAITFTNVLSACVHAGQVEEGLKIFSSMKTEYGVEPCQEHFTCIVDLLGKSSRIEEAEAFIDNMPINPGSDVWGALLSSCVIFGNIKIADKAAKVLADLDPNGSIWRVCLSNLYANAGRWGDVAKIRGEIRGSKNLKERGWSMLNLRGRRISFMAGDTTHPNSGIIYQVLNGLHLNMSQGSDEQ